MFGFEKTHKPNGLAARVEKIAMGKGPVSHTLEKLLATPPADEELSSLLLQYQEIRAHQESGSSAGLTDSQQLTELENRITLRARHIGLFS